MKNKFASLIITCSLVMGACVSAFAAPTTADQYAQYSGTGWSYNSSSHNFIANNQLTNSVPYVILSYLRDMYSQLSFDNSGYGYSFSNNTMRGIDITGNGKTSGGLYNIGKLIGLLNTNLMSQFVFTTNANEVPLYSWKNFIDTNLYSWSFSNDDFIDNFVNGIASVNNNVAYIANQLYSDSSNNRSLINQAFHSIVTNLDILSDIDNNTDGLEGINTDIKNNTGYIYTESQGIHSDTSDIKSINSNIYTESQGIHSDTSDIKSINSNIYTESQGIHSDTTDLNTKIQNLTDNYNNIDWTTTGNYLGTKKDSLNNEYLTSDTAGNTFYSVLNIPDGYSIFNVKLPLYAVAYTMSYPIDVSIGYTYGQSYEIDYYVLSTHADRTGLYITFYLEPKSNYGIPYYIKVYNRSGFQFVNNPAIIQSIPYDNIDFYPVSNYVQNDNLVKLFKQAKEMFFDDDSIALKKQEKSKTDTALGAITGSGSASASGDDFNGVGDSVSSVKSGINTGTNVSNILGVFNSSDGFGWFSSETANDIDKVNNNNTRLLRSNSNTEYPLVTQRLNELYSVMGGLND